MIVITATDADTLPAAARDILETGREYATSELTTETLRAAGAVDVTTREAGRKPPTRYDRIAALAAAVGNDGTGDLGVIVDHAPADATTADLAEIVREAREDALVEREREAR